MEDCDYCDSAFCNGNCVERYIAEEEDIARHGAAAINSLSVFARQMMDAEK